MLLLPEVDVAEQGSQGRRLALGDSGFDDSAREIVALPGQQVAQHGKRGLCVRRVAPVGLQALDQVLRGSALVACGFYGIASDQIQGGLGAQSHRPQ